MEEKIYIRDFPEFIRLEIKEDILSSIFSNIIERISNEIVDVEYHGTQELSEFLHGEIGGKIVEALLDSPLSSREIIKRTGLSKNTFYHKIAEMKREGVVEGRYQLTGKVRFANLRKLKSLAPDKRRRKGISKEDVIIALYLWPKYKDACIREGIDPEESRYSTSYRDVFSLAQAVKMWKKGKHLIPKWAAVALAEATGKVGELESEGAIISYTVPPGIKVQPYYNGKYKIPIKAGVELDIIAAQLSVKGSGGKYRHKNKEKFFKRISHLFGTFPQKGRVPNAIMEILKKYYGLHNRKEHARIPSRIFKKLRNLRDPEKMETELALLEGILEVGSPVRGYIEITSRSKEFLEDLSQLSQSLGIGELNVRKRRDRPHYRCEISLKKIDAIREKTEHLKRLYLEIDKLYPDFRVWDGLPLNRIREKIRATDGKVEKLEEICREELSHYLNLVLESISRNNPIYRRSMKNPKLKEEIIDYFWTNKKIPSSRSVNEFLQDRLNNSVPYPFL
jgi:DNA-binding transcriptional ArsR family regulator